MKKENKDLLLKYLCMALPYRTAIKDDYGDITFLDYNDVHIQNYFEGIVEGVVRPYLRPMSSMTEEEFTELHNICPHSTFNKTNVRTWLVGLNGSEYGRITHVDEMCIFISWLLEHHFDFMGLIPKCLSIEVTEENNPYKN